MILRLISMCLSLSFFPVTADADQLAYGEQVAKLPSGLSKLLAERNKPDASGANGRNRKSYFHVRFQMGLHHLADFAIVDKNPAALEYFVSAMEYSFERQLENGEFELIAPAELSGLGNPSVADKASGVAFFASSAGAGWLAVETSAWCAGEASRQPLMTRLESLQPKLRATLEYLISERETLEKADGHAPNRLLFDAIAFHTLGELVEDEEARTIAGEFVSLGARQVHEDGYFIEAGGYDSSYNGVAVALALRLVMMGYTDELEGISKAAIDWQVSRIEEAGEIATEGNTRVNPAGGESFLGRQKDVDVGHTIEALMLATVVFEKESYEKVAERVLGFYSKR